MRKSTRPGFHLVELVVLIAIVVVLLLLLFPSVQKVRDGGGAQGQTMNNLRQCALAIHNYHTVYNKFPNAAWTGGIYTKDQRSMWFHLLPYVEQDRAYKDNIHDAVISAYLAPSDPYIASPEGRINFAGNIRLFGYNTLTAKNANNAVDPVTGKPTGLTLRTELAAAMSSGLTLARIPDGVSNVLMLTTRYAECGSPAEPTYYSASPIGTLLANGGAGFEIPTPSIGIPKGPTKGAYFGAGAHTRPADASSPDAIFQVVPKYDTQCRPDDSVFGQSFRRDGLQVALADASVKLVAPTISPTIFCRALCPSDGYPVPKDWATGD
jgi:type II secretory pathway pseudopilin PulG